MHLGATLKDVFGGEPGWLNAVPANTLIDFTVGRVEGPSGTFVRSPASHRWTYAPQALLMGPAS